MESKIHPVEYSYFEIRQLISVLIAKYPFLGKDIIGRSVAGRDITALSIGSGEEYVVFVGGDDPACRISTLLLLKFCEEVCHCILHGKELCGLNMRKALFGRGIIFIPQLNPDGAEIAGRGVFGGGYADNYIKKLCNGKFDIWRSNLRGVEIWRNFPYRFGERKLCEQSMGIHGPAPIGFSGYKEISEPETLALVELCRNKKIRYLIHLSSFGENVCYSGDPITPIQSEKMAEVIAAVSAYSVCPPITKEYGGICDWFTYEFSKPAVCIKIGEESIPSVDELYKQYAILREALTLSSLF